MARSITTRSTNPKIMDDNIKLLDDVISDVEDVADDVALLTANSFVKGSNNIGSCIYAAHTTGSGNYIDFFIPCSYDPTITTGAIADTSTLAIYLPAKVLTASDVDFTAPITITKCLNGLRVEIKFAGTQVINTPATIGFNTATLSLS